MLIEKLLVVSIILIFASLSQIAVKPVLSAIDTEKEIIENITNLQEARDKSLFLSRVVVYKNITFFPNGTCSSGQIQCNKKVINIGKYFTIKISYDKNKKRVRKRTL